MRPTVPPPPWSTTLFADAERILARGEYEGIADAESFHTKLAGVTFEGRQERRRAPRARYAAAAWSGSRTTSSTRAPSRVFDPVGDQVGFLNRRLAAVLAPQIDRAARTR